MRDFDGGIYSSRQGSTLSGNAATRELRDKEHYLYVHQRINKKHSISMAV
jgi:hypothetical protein